MYHPTGIFMPRADPAGDRHRYRALLRTASDIAKVGFSRDFSKGGGRRQTSQTVIAKKLVSLLFFRALFASWALVEVALRSAEPLKLKSVGGMLP